MGRLQVEVQYIIIQVFSRIRDFEQFDTCKLGDTYNLRIISVQKIGWYVCWRAITLEGTIYRL